MKLNDLPKYCLSLKRREDRRESIRSNLQNQFDFQFFDAIDGMELNIPSEYQSWKGTFGCRFSYGKLFAKLLSKGIEEVMIFEDDVILPDNETINELLKHIPDDWDCVNLSSNYTSTLEKPNEGKFYKVDQWGHAYCTVCLLVRKKAMCEYIAAVMSNPLEYREYTHADICLSRACREAGLNYYFIKSEDSPIKHDLASISDNKWGQPDKPLGEACPSFWE